MDLQDYRKQIDLIDDELLALFRDRMGIANQIAHYKKANGLPVYDADREREKLDAIGGKAGDELRPYSDILFETLFALSRDYQETVINP